MKDKTTLLIALVALYVAAELISNATAGRLVQVGSLVVPGAIFLYALTFTLRDAVHTAGGWRVAKALVWIGVAANALLALYGLLVVNLPAPSFFDARPYGAVFGATARVVLASLCAYVVSTSLDALVFERLRRNSLAARVMASNLVSTVLDSAVFVTLAFAGTGAPLLALMFGQAVVKLVVSAALIPLVYWVRARMDRGGWTHEAYV